jgi:hypothetical protein
MDGSKPLVVDPLQLGHIHVFRTEHILLFRRTYHFIYTLVDVIWSTFSQSICMLSSHCLSGDYILFAFLRVRLKVVLY